MESKRKFISTTFDAPYKAKFGTISPTLMTLAQEAPKVLPKIWDWRDKYEIDSPDILTKKKKISPVTNQLNCGSCWAVSTANAISDAFVIADLSPENPILSATSLLSCYTNSSFKDSSGFTYNNNNGCEGGDIFSTLFLIEKNGISSRHCVDYSWCINNKECNNGQVPTQQVQVANTINNDAFPTCGCYFEDEHQLYYITNIIKFPRFYSKPSSSDINTIKSLVFANGPVIGGVRITKSFTDTSNGDFSETGGIYIPSHIYSGRSSDDDGGHAICIMGWGEAFVPSEKSTVQYFMCRNTWGDDWGDKGYVKISTSAFFVIVSFLPNGNNIPNPKTNLLKELSWKTGVNIPTRVETDSFYKKESVKDTPVGDIKKQFNLSSTFILVSAFIIILLIYLISYS